MATTDTSLAALSEEDFDSIHGTSLSEIIQAWEFLVNSSNGAWGNDTNAVAALLTVGWMIG